VTELFNQKKLTGLRKTLRNQSTQAELLLWKKINNRQLNGWKFWRQFSIGNYILDFYCPRKRLAIEIDDIHHFDPESVVYDKDRTVYLNNLGIMVIRYTNTEVIKQIDKIVEDILRKMEKI